MQIQTQNDGVKKALEGSALMIPSGIADHELKFIQGKTEDFYSQPLENRIRFYKAQFGTRSWADQMRLRYYVGREILDEWWETIGPYTQQKNGEYHTFKGGQFINWKKRGKAVHKASAKGGPGGQVVEHSLSNLAEKVKTTDKTLKNWIEFAFQVDKDLKKPIDEYINIQWGTTFKEILAREMKPEDKKPDDPDIVKAFKSLYSGLGASCNACEKIRNLTGYKGMEPNDFKQDWLASVFFRAWILHWHLRDLLTQTKFEAKMEKARKEGKKKAEEEKAA